MSELPTVSGREAIRVLTEFGFEIDRTRGSHYALKKEVYPYLLTVPVHGNKALMRGTLRRIIRDAGLTVEEFAAKVK